MADTVNCWSVSNSIFIKIPAVNIGIKNLSHLRIWLLERIISHTRASFLFLFFFFFFFFFPLLVKYIYSPSTRFHAGFFFFLFSFFFFFFYHPCSLAIFSRGINRRFRPYSLPFVIWLRFDESLGNCILVLVNWSLLGLSKPRVFHLVGQVIWQNSHELLFYVTRLVSLSSLVPPVAYLTE